MAIPVLPNAVAADGFNGFPEPFYSRLGPYSSRELGDHFDLSAFGVSLETLPSGSQSALRHWHSKSDEFVWMLEGVLVLVTDEGESLFTPGMCVGYKAGEPNGHHLINRSEEDAVFLVVGSRAADDNVHYPDDDIQWLKSIDGKFVAARKDGSAY